jgi:hypothetical protein
MSHKLGEALIHVFKDLKATQGYREFDSLPEAFQTQITDVLKSHHIPVDNLEEVIDLPIQCIVNDESEVCIISIFFDDEEGDQGLIQGTVLYSFDETTEVATKIYEQVG